MMTTETMMETVVEYPIIVTLKSGTVLTVHATRDTIEGYYGNVNELVNQMVKPLADVERIEVELFSPEMGELVTEVTYDVMLEAWKTLEERVVITYNFHGIEERERGYISRKDGWLPCYTLRKISSSTASHALITDDIVSVRSTKLVNREAKRARQLDAYHRNPEAWNAKRMMYHRRQKAQKQA